MTKELEHADEKASSIAGEVLGAVRMIVACGSEGRIAQKYKVSQIFIHKSYPSQYELPSLELRAVSIPTPVQPLIIPRDGSKSRERGGSRFLPSQGHNLPPYGSPSTVRTIGLLHCF
jgi:hypothetical protein